MSQGYPARKRTRKAYWRGVKSAKFARAVNPYKNTVLRELFERGRSRSVPNDPLGQRPSPSQPPRSPRPGSDRPSDRRGDDRRDPFRGR
jgi:hypothetical protein